VSAPQHTAPQHTGPPQTGPPQTEPQQVTGAHECARAWSALTAAHARVASQLGTALQRACGLTVTDFEILLRLDTGHGTGDGAGLRVGDLTGVIRLSQPALSRAAARLADRGWLTRAGSPDDARCVLLNLTPAGRDILATATAAHSSVIREALLDRLTPAEQDVLARVLARIADG
jgi:DNA-binding MarR family transcriptional regulator